MSDTRQVQEDSELHSERGTTTIAGTIVSQIAEIATNRMKGIRVGDVTTNVGKYEAALDFKMGMEFGRDLKELTSEIRSRISSQVEGMTGLKVKEQNIIVTDIFFPEDEDDEDGRKNRRKDRRNEETSDARETRGGVSGETERDETGRDGEEGDEESGRNAKDETGREIDRESDLESDREVLLDTEEDDEKDRENKPKDNR